MKLSVLYSVAFYQYILIRVLNISDIFSRQKLHFPFETHRREIIAEKVWRENGKPTVRQNGFL
jgi:hypothetical protein